MNSSCREICEPSASVNVWISASRKFLLRELNQEKSVRCVESTKSNTIIGVVTAICERLPLSCENRRVPIIHGPMISRLIGRGTSGNQAGQSGSSAGRSPRP
ncbi:hypothetical protein F511_21305 [Dorcoceras hygrometricum]|uniref:Uncharacterized protein n=1 Tax=Dorcoceras hygrometricum TaxID=472368 RepID=A0A2Z7BBV7_9LAMI|nr:hypothetical protein F511_21305 [Dorcoceras hygrometricum]